MRGILTAILALTTTTASAQIACGDKDAVLSYGAVELGQFPAITLEGIQGDFVVLTNPDTGAWSILRIMGGQACVMATGSGVRPAGLRL